MVLLSDMEMNVLFEVQLGWITGVSGEIRDVKWIQVDVGPLCFCSVLVYWSVSVFCVQINVHRSVGGIILWLHQFACVCPSDCVCALSACVPELCSVDVASCLALGEQVTLGQYRGTECPMARGGEGGWPSVPWPQGGRSVQWMHPKWHTIPISVLLWPKPYEPWSKVVHCRRKGFHLGWA